MSNRVEAVGPKDAMIMLIGEAPGAMEERDGLPFVGTAGKVLNGILQETDIERDKCYITNVSKKRPKNNDFRTFYAKKGTAVFPSKYLNDCIAELHGEITEVQPNVIVPMGVEALRAVLGSTYKGIGDYRGSIILHPGGRKIIPTYHPAAILRQWQWRPVTVQDFRRIRAESTFPGHQYTERTIYSLPPIDTIKSALEGILRTNLTIAVDVEVESDQICTIGIANSAGNAWVIPLWFQDIPNFWQPQEEMEILTLLKEILESPTVGKVFHNAMYDIAYLKRSFGICVSNIVMDTMLAFHVLYPELPKALAFLTSIYTDQPYYKFMRKTESHAEHMQYNGLDACVTYECFERLQEELASNDMSPFYYNFINQLIPFLNNVAQKGLLVDTSMVDILAKATKQTQAVLLTRIETAVGNVNVNSPKQIQTLLYETLHLPPKYRIRKGDDGKSKTLTSDEEALQELYDDTRNDVLHDILELRKANKFYSTYLKAKLDDGRLLGSFNIAGTETGRLSSSQTPWSTGLNLQNIDPKFKVAIIPDSGKLLGEFDFSSAENWIVAYLSRDTEMIQVLRQGKKFKVYVASILFNKPYEQVTENEAAIGKMVGHAMSYGMTAFKLASELPTSIVEAKRLLSIMHNRFPKIGVWHREVQATLSKTRYLKTPIGRIRQFMGRWNQDLHKEAYAHIPQSTVSDLLLQQALLLPSEYATNLGLDVLDVVHDSILFQAWTFKMDEACRYVKTVITRHKLRINHVDVTIPGIVKVGTTWGDMKPFLEETTYART